MAILSDFDKQKTVAEYLGISGTNEQVIKELEKSEKVRELINPILDYQADDLFHNMRPYPFVAEKLAFMKLEDIERNKATLLPEMKGFYKEILSDFSEEYGDAKQKPFLRATGYDSSRDGDEKGYFFRFWRAPVKKLLDYRGIDPSTSDGRNATIEILKRIFGPDTTKHDLNTLIQEWPEHLVENRAELERQYQEMIRNREAEEALLKVKPLHESLAHFAHIRFTDTTDNALTASEAFAHPETSEILSKLLKTKEKIDIDTLRDTIDLTPQQIEMRAAMLTRELTLRNDLAYIAANPTVPFSKFLADRRPDIPFGEDEKNRTLRTALETVIKQRPVDNKAVKEAMDVPCSELEANADKIIKGVGKRKNRKKLVIIGLLAAANLGLYGLYSHMTSENSDAESKKAPTPQKTEMVQKADQTAQPSAGMSQKLATVTNTPSAVAEKPASQPTTVQQEDTPAPQPVAKPSMPQKGNRLVAMQWVGYKNLDCTRPEPQAQQWIIEGEFYDMFQQIKSSGLTYKDLFHPEFLSQALKQLDNQVKCGVRDQELHEFYIRNENTRTRDAIMTDVLNFHMNARDVLESLPVSQENLAKAQLLTMDAIGPSLGWSVKQQMGWQSANSNFTQHAEKTITDMAMAGMKERKVDTNNVEAVFMEVINAASVYRGANPKVQGLLLTVDKITRKVAGIEAENMSKFSQISKTERGEARRYLDAADRKEEQEFQESLAPKTPVIPQSEKEEKSGYSWWWIAAAVAGTYYLTSLHIKRKNKIIR